MADLQITGEVVVEADKAEAAFERLGNKAEKMGSDVSAAARKAGTEVDKMGDGAGGSAEKFTRSESRISDSIKRTTKRLEELGKTASQKLELQIADKGLDASKFEPLLKKLREAEAAQLALAKASATAGTQGAAALDKIGISAKQTAAAMRGVPAQFTDIVTSLQGGQAPLTVLLQQGGQLKDMFGGVGNAARALGGYVLGLVNPFSVAAVAAAGLGFVVAKGQKEQSEYAKAIILSGNAAGVTTGQLQGYAQAISQVTGTQGGAAAALQEFVQFGKVGAENLQSFTLAAIKFEKSTGTAVSDTVKQFAELGKAPVDASVKLNDSINFLTVDLFKQINALESQGKATEAAALAQKSFADVIDTRAGRIVENIGTIEAAWKAVKRAITGAADAALNVGRAAAPKEIADDKRGQIANLEELISSGAGGAETVARRKVLLDLRKQELAFLTETEKVVRRTADGESERAAQTKAGIEFIQQGNKFLSDKQRLEKEIIQTRNLGIAAGLTEEVIQKRIADIREKANKGGSKSGLASGGENEVASIIARTKAQRDYFALLQEKGKPADDLTEGQKLTIKIQEQLKTSITGVARAEKERALVAAQELVTVDLLIQGEKKRVKAEEEAMKVATTRQQLQQKESDSIESYIRAEEQARIATVKAANDSVAAAQAEYDNYGKTKSQIAEVTLARLKDQLAGVNAGTAISESLEAQITAQKQLIGILASGEAREINDKAAKDAADEWKKTAESIQTSITDALLRGFESGKGFGKNLRDTIVNMFKTLVLRPTISAIVNPVAGAITSSLGLAGAANAATGGGNILGTLSNLSSLSTITSAISTGVAGAVGSTVGSIFGAVAGNTALGTTLGLGASSSLAAASAASVAGGGAAAGAGLGALTSTLGGIGPAGWAALAAIAIAGFASGRGETRSGATYDTGADGLARYQQGPSGGEINGDAARQAFNATQQTITGTLAALGSKAVLSGFTAGLESSKNGKGFEFAGGQINGVGFGEFGGRSGGQFGFKSQDAQAAFNNYILQLKQSTVEALQAATDLPKAVADQLKGIDIGSLEGGAVDQLMANINAVIVSVSTFQQTVKNSPFVNLKDLSFDAASGLISVAGGLDALQSNLATYYESFYSEEEKRLQTIKAINAATSGSGLDAATATRDSFRALVSAQDLTTESGRKTYTSLLAVSSSLASITPAAQEAATAVKKASDLFLNLSREGANLQADLLEAQGNKQGATTTRRALVISGYTQAEIDEGAVALYDYNASLRAQIEAARAASTALEEVTAKDKARAENTKSERKAIDDQINALTDTEAQALARQREALDASNRTRFDELQAIKATSAALEASKVAMQSFDAGIAGTIAKFSTPEQARADQYGSIARGLKAAGLASADYSALASDLQGASKDQIKAVAQQIFNGLGKGAGVAKESLRVLADQLADLKNTEAAEAISATNAALEKRTKAQNDAMAMLEKSVAVERRAAQTQADLAAQTINTIKSIFDLLKSNVNDIYGAVESTRTQAGRQGNAFIDNALLAAQTTGYLPDQAALADAIAASRKDLESTVFETQNAEDIARLELAGKLSQLKDLSGKQLTEAERQAASAKTQLEYFDNLLISERSQLDALQGLNTSVLSVPQALAALLSAKSSTPPASSPSTTSSAGGIVSAGPSKVSDYTIDAMIYGTRGKQIGDDGNKELYDWAYKWKDSGVTLARLNEVAGVPAGTAEKWAKANGLPAFAKGGMHSGGWAMVGEDGPEVAYMPPARIYSAPDTRAMLSGIGNSDAAIERLTARVEELTKELEKVTMNTARTAEATNGRPDRPMLVEVAA